MQRPTFSRLNTAAISAIVLICTLFLLFGAFGYLRFGSAIDSNILNSYDKINDPVIVIAASAYAFTTVFSIPVIATVLRNSIRTIFFPQMRTLPTKHHFLTTFVAIGLALSISLTEITLGTVFKIAGSLMGSSLTYTLPALFFLRATRRRHHDRVQNDEEDSWSELPTAREEVDVDVGRGEGEGEGGAGECPPIGRPPASTPPICTQQRWRWIAYLIALGGVVFTIISFSCVIYSLVKGNGGSQPITPPITTPFQ